jgi:6-phosphogluconolactonase
MPPIVNRTVEEISQPLGISNFACGFLQAADFRALVIKAFTAPFLAALTTLTLFVSDMNAHSLFIGTYTRETSKGIYSLTLDATTGELSTPVVAAETKNPSYLALSPDHKFLYAVSEADAMAVSFSVGPEGKLTSLQSPQPAEGKAPCHLVVDRTGRTLLVANYQTGVLASIPILPDGTLGHAGSIIQHTGSSVDPARQTSAHMHSVTLSPDNRHVIACDLGLDKIFTYRLDPASARLSSEKPAFTAATPGSGPRHFAFSPSGQFGFCIAEMSATLTAYRYHADNGSLMEVDHKSTLPSDFHGPNSAAAVRVHPNGRFVYSSNRGADNIAVFAFDEAAARLSLVEIVPSGGKNPRDFALSPDGKWLVAAHQDSQSLIVFRVDAQTGRLTRTASAATVSMPVCVLFAD